LRLAGVREVLQKPFTADDLGTAIGRVIALAAGAPAGPPA